MGVNPQINNMHPRYVAARYSYILVSDAGMRSCKAILFFKISCNLIRFFSTFLVKRNTLRDMVSRIMKNGYGLIHQMPFFCDRPGFSTSLEQVRLLMEFEFLFPLLLFNIHPFIFSIYLLRHSARSDLLIR